MTETCRKNTEPRPKGLEDVEDGLHGESEQCINIERARRSALISSVKGRRLIGSSGHRKPPNLKQTDGHRL